MKIAIFEENVIRPFEQLGFTSKFFHINIETIINTWIAMVLMFSLVLIARYFLKKDLNPIALIFEKSVEFFNSLCKESFGSSFRYEYFAFVSTIFFFTLFGCLIGLLPFLDETTKDINTAFALGTLSFLYVQWKKIKINGIKQFFKEFTEPIFILLPLNIIGEFAKVASMSFRLFGNILGGSIIFLIAINALEPYKLFFIIFSFSVLFIFFILNKLVDLKKYKYLDYTIKSLLVAVFFLAGAQMFFGIFEGFVQSFVLTMLTITYLAVAIQKDDDDESLEKEEVKG
jgi:F-type H+-transporting ATPase subunit a